MTSKFYRSNNKLSFDTKLDGILKATQRTGNASSGIANLKQLSRTEIPKYAQKIVAIPAFAEVFKQTLFPKNYSHFGQVGLSSSSGLERELIWYVSLFNIYKKELSSFIKLYRDFESTVLFSTAEAKRKLETIKKEFGLSFWSIENEYSLIRVEQGEDVALKYVDGISSIQGLDRIMFSLSRLIGLRDDRSVSLESFEDSVRNKFNNDGYNQYLYFKTCHYGRYPITDFNSILVYEGSSSLIDRYFTFIGVCRTILGNSSFDKYRPLIKMVLDMIDSDIDDKSIRTLRVHLGDYPQIVNSPELKNIVVAGNLYTQGKYTDLIAHVKTGIDSLKRVDGELIALASTSISRLPTPSNGTSYGLNTRISEIIDALVKINRREPGSFEALDLIRRIANSNSTLEWSSFLILTAELGRGEPDWYPGVASRTYCEMNLSLGNPRAICLLEGADRKINYLMDLEHQFGSLSSAALYKAVVSSKFDNLEHVLQDRVDLYIARNKMDTGSHADATQLYSKLLKSNDIIIQYEAIQALAALYLESQNIGKAADLISSAYLENPMLYPVLPFYDLYGKIRTGITPDLHSNISLVICLTVLAKHGHGGLDGIIFSLYEDFMAANDIEKPSAIASIKGKYDLKKLVYFAQEVCIPAIIDSSIVFDGSKAIEDERIAVCRLIISLDPDLSQRAVNEIGTITKTQFLRTRIRDIEQSKIYVNIENIRKASEGEIRDLYLRYQLLLKEDKHNAMIQHIVSQLLKTQSSDERIPIFIPPLERAKLFASIVNKVRDEFVSSGDHGLDGYLSVRIRHGTLAGHLRASLEASRLMSKRAEGIYQKNEYWTSKLNETPGIAIEIDGHLSTFSEKIDKIIEHLKERIIQIRGPQNKEGLFSYEISARDLGGLETFITAETSFKEFLDLTLDFLWNYTEENLKHIRAYIESEVLKQINDAFLVLLGSVGQISHSAQSTTQIKELEFSIKNAQTNIVHDINKVTDWFKRSREAQSPDFKLKEPFDVAAETVRRISPSRSFEVNITEQGELLFRGQLFKAFVDIGFILFENIIKHSKVEDRSPNIRLTLGEKKGKVIITLRNDVDATNFDSEVAKMKALVEKLNGQNDVELVKKEGGSGFHKIMKILRIDLKTKPALEAGYDKGKKEFHCSFDFSGEELVIENSNR